MCHTQVCRFSINCKLTVQSKKCIDQEPPYLMRQICVLQWEEIKTNNSTSVGTLGLFAFLPRSTARDVNVFIFQKNDRFFMKTTTKNRKRNDRLFKKFVF